MTYLSASELFGDAGIPLRMREAIARRPSHDVTAESVKIVFSLGGVAEVLASDQKVILSEGTILTIPFALECSGFPSGWARTVTMYVDIEFLTEQIQWLPPRHPLVYQLGQILSNDSRMHILQIPRTVMTNLAPHLARMAHTLPAAENYFATLSMVSGVFETIGRFATSPRTPQSSLPNLGQPRREVLVAMDLLQQHLPYPWNIEELARRVALSSSQLRRLFRSSAGVSPARYLMEARADRMAELLITTTLNVSEAAKDVGWANATVGARAFKRRHGLTPTEFVRIARSAAPLASTPSPRPDAHCAAIT